MSSGQRDRAPNGRARDDSCTDYLTEDGLTPTGYGAKFIGGSKKCTDSGDTSTSTDAQATPLGSEHEQRFKHDLKRDTGSSSMPSSTGIMKNASGKAAHDEATPPPDESDTGGNLTNSSSVAGEANQSSIATPKPTIGINSPFTAAPTVTKSASNKRHDPNSQHANAAVATPAASGSRSGGLGPLSSGSFQGWKVGDRFDLIKILGHGSYGQVAEAVDKTTGDKVAIKCIANVFDQEVDTKRILREAQILRHLDHDNVIRLLDIVTPPNPDFNEIYLVFEFVDTDLHKLINSPQYLSIDHVRTFLYQMLCAVGHVHSASVIHRDLKPANILLNEDCSLKICDFGLARVAPKARFDKTWQSDPGNSSRKRHRTRSVGSSDDELITESGEQERDGDYDANVNSNVSGIAEKRRKQADGEGTASKATPPPPTKRLVRSLTRHVITRWYRPPEIILAQDYSSAVDMWSIGCIFAELLGMEKGSIKSFKDRGPLFPGKSCFPLSADNDKTYKDRKDQLNVIFSIIGTPAAEDIEHLGRVKNYLKDLVPKPRKDFFKVYRAAPKEAIDLLNKMLIFNPSKRISVQEALDHPFLKAVRTPGAEALAAKELPIRSETESSKEELKTRLLEELQHYSRKLV